MSRYVSLPGALLLLVLIITSIISSDSVQAGTSGWTGGGPEGGPISQLAVARSNPSIVYLSSEAGVFKSTDAGSTWESVHRVPVSLHDQSLVVDPDDPDTVFWYSIENGVLRTTDGGDQWKLLLPYESNAFYSFVVNPDRPEVLYLLRQGNNVHSDTDVFFSTDGGTGWNRMSTPLPGPTQLVVAGRDPEFIFASVARGNSAPAHFRSTDSGQTWIELDKSVKAITAAPGDGRAVYGLAVTSTSVCEPPATTCPLTYESIVWKSTDAGTSWTESFRIDRQLNHLTVSQSNPSDVYVTGYGPAYRSRDAGQTWTPLAETGPNLTAFNGETLLEFDSKGVRKSTNGGVTWEEANTGLTGLAQVHGIWLLPGESSAAYIRTDLGVFRTDDRGESWDEFEIPAANDFEVAASGNPDVMYLTRGIELHRSGDSGVTWEKVHQFAEQDESYVDITIDPHDTDTLYAAHRYTVSVFWFPSWRTITETRYSRSTDGGRSWSTIDPHRLPFAFHPTMYRVWWTFDDETLLKTSNNGQTFEVVGGLPPGYLYIDPANPQTMYAPSNTGLWKSTDGGQNWSLTGLRDTDVRSFSIDPECPSTLLATTLVKITSADVYGLPYSRYQGSVLRSDDGGVTWRELPSPVLADDFSVPGVVFGSGHAAYIFNAAPGGVYSMVVDGLGPARQPGSRWRRGVSSTRSSNTVSSALRHIAPEIHAPVWSAAAEGIRCRTRIPGDAAFPYERSRITE